MQTNFISVLAEWNNVDIIPAAVAQALLGWLSMAVPSVCPDTTQPNSYNPLITPSPVCNGVTVTTVTQATPTVTGVNQINIQLTCPEGTSASLVEQFVTSAILLFNSGLSTYYATWPTMGTVVIQSMTVIQSG